MTRGQVLLMAGFVLLNLGACSSKVERSDVLGEYVATYSFGVEKLQLNPDGTYVQTVTLKGKTAATQHSGTWDYAPSRGVVTVHDSLHFSDPFGKMNPNYATPLPGAWIMIGSKTLGSVSLNWNDDSGVKFEKLKER